MFVGEGQGEREREGGGGGMWCKFKLTVGKESVRFGTCDSG